MTGTRQAVLIAVAAFAAGTLLWWLSRPATRDPARLDPPAISGPALYAAAFRDAQEAPQPLGRFQDRLLVVNFWATWCGPCRDEMPLFQRLQDAWAARGVQFVGLSAEPPPLAARFGKQAGIRYPLWTGEGEVMELSRRLGNHAGVLPHTVVVAPGGRIVAAKVGAYSEEALTAILRENAPKSP